MSEIDSASHGNTQGNYSDLSTLTDDDLRSLIEAATAEIARRTPRPAKVRVAREFGCYNDRRYGRPWIGRIASWPVGGKPEIEWGSYLGDAMGGEAEVMAHVGDIIRWGQRDGRNPRKTDNEWAVVEADGTLRDIDAAEARRLYVQR
jgi:hypothetical protein